MDNAEALLKNSELYREFCAEREEILKHKWLESEKAGYDIGFEKALTDWIVKYRAKWRKNRMQLKALEDIRKDGLQILIFDNLIEFNRNNPLSHENYRQRIGLEAISGVYVVEQNKLKRMEGESSSEVIAGVFADEYKDGQQNYRLHLDKGMELKVRLSENCLEIIEPDNAHQFAA